MPPGTHWGISIDRNLITPAIQRRIDAEVQANSANLESPPQVAYTRDGLVIDLTAMKPWGLCGNGFFGFDAYLGQHSAGSMRRSIAILYATQIEDSSNGCCAGV